MIPLSGFRSGLLDKVGLCYSLFTRKCLHSSSHWSSCNLLLFKFWPIPLKPGKNCRCIVSSHRFLQYHKPSTCWLQEFLLQRLASMLAENFVKSWVTSEWEAVLHDVTNTSHSQTDPSWPGVTFAFQQHYIWRELFSYDQSSWSRWFFIFNQYTVCLCPNFVILRCTGLHIVLLDFISVQIAEGHIIWITDTLISTSMIHSNFYQCIFFSCPFYIENLCRIIFW